MEKQIFNERTLLANVPVGADHEENVWRMSEVCHSNTSFPRVVKVKLLHKASEKVLSPLRDVINAVFERFNRKGEGFRSHAILV